ncbi:MULTISPECIES: PAS domain S-box protein [Haloferacaceae]|uniref:histidine kinase n=1 Tax=Halorubrum glutamatedens TaxID=2707018 RepID=A0ABD5QT02_9EURY|nr:PAS domain S-box protein [Halobellus captivus]
MTESEHRYQQLIRTSPAPINLFDASGEVIWGNDAVVTLLDLESREELVGRSIFEFIHPDDRYTAEEELTAVVEEKISTGPTTLKLERDDGEIRKIRVATAPGRYAGRDIGQAVVIDVTELNRIQEELKRERTFIEKALNGLDDVFYVVDTAGALERWNDALTEVSGYSEEEVREMDVEEFFVADDVERVSTSISRTFAEGSAMLEATVRTKRGTKIPFEFRKQRLSIDDTVIGIVGIGRDISHRRTREQHLQAVDLLLQHQLRNQMNVIQGRVSLLQEQLADPANEHIKKLYAATNEVLSNFDHHRHLITQLTEITTSEHVDIAAILDALVAECRDGNPEATVIQDVPDTAMVEVTPAIEQALRGLFWTVIEHAETDTQTLEIELEETETSVRITITTIGPPIPEIEYAFMDDPTALKSTAHPSKLSLWSVYIAVTESGGTLTIDERDERGNVITIDLPTTPSKWK